MAQQVTDPALIAALNGGNPQAAQAQPITDPALLAQLTAPPSVALDAAKSLGVGTAEGAISLVGLPGDLQSPADGVSGWLTQKAEQYAPNLTKFLQESSAKAQKGPIGKALAEKSAGDLPIIGLPTSAQIKAPIENVTGEFYKPQTKAGEYAHSIGTMVPGSLIPAGGLNLLLRGAGAVGGGIGAQAAGDYTEGTALEPYARFGGGVFGALGGTNVARMLPAAMNYSATKSAASEAGHLLGENISTGAMRRVAKNIEADGITPASATARMNELGRNEALLLDMGRQVGGRAEAIAAQPGRGQNMVLDAVENRTGAFGAQVAARTKQTLDNVMGKSQDVVQLQKKVESIVDSYAHPAYKKVMSQHPTVWDADLEELAKRPAIRTAMDDAVSLAKNYGETIVNPFPHHSGSTALGPAGQVGPISATAKPSLQYWDYVKKAIDARINKLMKGGGIEDLGSKDKADLGGLLAAKNDLVSHLDDLTGGAYANARKLSATKFELREAGEVGRGALNSKMLPEELAEQMRGMSLPEQAMAQAHFRREIDRIIDSARNDGAAARRILDTNNNRQKIQEVFGARALDEIDARIAAETHFQTTKQKIADNSRTAVRQELKADTSTPPASQALSTSMTGALHAGARSGLNYLREQGMDRTREGIASLLTAKGDDARKIVDIVTRLNASRASRPVSPFSATVPQSLVFGSLAPVLQAPPR